MMDIQENVSLAPYTSLGCGGMAERLAVCSGPDEITSLLSEHKDTPIHIFGYGTNSLISDRGLEGLTIVTHGGKITLEDDLLSADSGVWWDDVVSHAISHGLWGLELTSGIPSGVGGAVVGNIAAYGQQVSDSIVSIEVFDTDSLEVKQIPAEEIDFSYRRSSLQQQSNLVILRANFRLSRQPTTALKYESALRTADNLDLNADDLEDRQKIIIETRRQAGSLYDPNDPSRSHTAGSFFKNPSVSFELAKELASFDETGKTLERVLQQNEVHGGEKTRASAAHVLLACGFSRGQTWGKVRLHPDHILKIENTGGASAQDIYDASKEIVETVQKKLGITLEPEVRFIGDFS